MKDNEKTLDNEKTSKLHRFLKEENGEYGTGLENCDFKFFMQEYYEYWNKDGKRYEGLIEDIKKEIGSLNTENEDRTNIGRWFAYRTLDVAYAEERKIHFRYFDCDDSNDTCELTKEIYDTLWGWKKYNEKSTDYGVSSVWGEDIALGGDTMNSFATTLLQYVKENDRGVRSVKECREEYKKGSFKEKFENAGLEGFAKYVSCIGNFVLVPAGFNGYRGTHKYLKDYWDLSLDYLADVKHSWLQYENKGTTRDDGFSRYINTFFLWDYVDENYEVKPLFGSHKKKLGSQNALSAEDLYPCSEDEFEEFFRNVNRFIRRRGQFMIAMLKIAVGSEYSKYEYNGIYSEKWKNWEVSGLYKEIMEKVFFKDTQYKGYKAVIEAITKIVKKIDDHFELNILEE